MQSNNPLTGSIMEELYKHVIEDTIQSSKELFKEEGIDEQILMELHSSWVSKLMICKAVNPPPQPFIPFPKNLPAAVAKNNKSRYSMYNCMNPSPMDQQQVQQELQQQVHTENRIKYTPIQITLPPQLGTQEVDTRVITINVPSYMIREKMLEGLLSGSVLGHSVALPTHLATKFIQQHVNNFHVHRPVATLQAVQPDILPDGQTEQQQQQQQFQQYSPTITCENGASPYKRTIDQIDGANDSSTSEDDDDTDDTKISDEDDNNDSDKDTNIVEEPLNSDDDISDLDDESLFETDNVLVCQFDKVTRCRNKWKLHFKSGIMNLNGYDYAFQRALGDSEW